MIIALTLLAHICGPQGMHDHSCNRWGWDGKRYRSICEGSARMPRRNDPWLRYYMIEKGDTRRDAQIELSDERTNSCDNTR